MHLLIYVPWEGKPWGWQYQFLLRALALGPRASLALLPRRLLHYFRGRHHLEEIMYNENMRRSQLLMLFDKFRSVLVVTSHEDPVISVFQSLLKWLCRQRKGNCQGLDTDGLKEVWKLEAVNSIPSCHVTYSTFSPSVPRFPICSLWWQPRPVHARAPGPAQLGFLLRHIHSMGAAHSQPVPDPAPSQGLREDCHCDVADSASPLGGRWCTRSAFSALHQHGCGVIRLRALLLSSLSPRQRAERRLGKCPFMPRNSVWSSLSGSSEDIGRNAKYHK